jgi:hypothetical protein
VIKDIIMAKSMGKKGTLCGPNTHQDARRHKNDANNEKKWQMMKGKWDANIMLRYTKKQYRCKKYSHL